MTNVLNDFTNSYFKVTQKEPIFENTNPDYCYLRSSEFTNNPAINQFGLGIVQNDDQFDSIFIKNDPKIRVRPSFILILKESSILKHIIPF